MAGLGGGLGREAHDHRALGRGQRRGQEVDQRQIVAEAPHASLVVRRREEKDLVEFHVVRKPQSADDLVEHASNQNVFARNAALQQAVEGLSAL